VLNYLYKNTELQITYHFNMVAIQDKTPKLLSLHQFLDAYIQHQKEVMIRQTTYDLNQAKTRAHIVEGLIKAISILDELIQTIRASKDKSDAKKQIIAKYDFTEEQAEAIVMLQLYRLTNTDITSLEREADELKKQIAELSLILNSEAKLFQMIKADLKQLKKTFGDERRTVIEEKSDDLTFDIEVTVAKEIELTSITRDGYVKRTSLRSYAASNCEEFAIKENYHLIRLIELNTTDHLLLFTNKGKFISFPVHELPDIRWKDMGQHISNLAALDKDEFIVQGIPVRSFDTEQYVVFFTKNGMIKRSSIKQYQVQRHSRSFIAINLKNDDEIVNVFQTDGYSDVFVATNTGYGLWYHESEVSVVGQRAAGVKSIQLKEGEHVVNGAVFDELHEPSLVVVTQRGACKRMELSEFTRSTRAKRGLAMLRELKRKSHRIKGFMTIYENESIYFATVKGEVHHTVPLELSASDRYSNGSFVIDVDHQGEVTEVWKDARYDKPFEDIDS